MLFGNITNICRGETPALQKENKQKLKDCMKELDAIEKDAAKEHQDYTRLHEEMQSLTTTIDRSRKKCGSIAAPIVAVPLSQSSNSRSMFPTRSQPAPARPVLSGRGRKPSTDSGK